MSDRRYKENNQANESISKYKLLSAYGGPGSLVHTDYGSIAISCIEEWGFIRKVEGWNDDAERLGKDHLIHIKEQCKLENINISNDKRLLNSLKERIGLANLELLTLIPDIEINEITHRIIDGGVELAINSSFMPKVFADRNKSYK